MCFPSDCASSALVTYQVGAWSSESEGEDPKTKKLFYLSTEPGAAAREGWYDLEVQTAKKGFSSAPGDGQWEGREEWATVRVSGEDGAPDEKDDCSGGKKPAAKKKKSGTREFGKRSKSQTGRNYGEKQRSKAEAAGGGGAGGGGSRRDDGDGDGGGGGGGRGEAAAAALAEDNGSNKEGSSSSGGDGGGGGHSKEDKRAAAGEEPPEGAGAAAAGASSAQRDSGAGARPDASGAAQAPLSSSRKPGGDGAVDDGGTDGRVGKSGERPSPGPAGNKAPISTAPSVTGNGGTPSEPASLGPAKRRREEGE